MSLVYPGDRPEFLYEIKRILLSQKSSLSMKCRILLENNEYIWIEIEGRVVEQGINTRPLRMFGVFKDINEQKKLIESLENRNRYIESIVENMPIGLAVNYIDSGRADYMNRRFAEIYGWPADKITGVEKFFEQVYPDPEYREQLKKRIMDDISSGDPKRMHWEGVKITTEDGSHKIVNAKNIPIFDQNLMVSLVEDVTEKNELENKLRQSQKMEAIGTLAGGIAHDFNNILTAIMGFAEILQRKMKDTDDDPFEINEIVIASRRAAELVSQILTFSRMKEKEKLPLDLAALVKEAVKLIRASIPASIEIVTEVSAGSAVILGDPTQIHQILLNLCANAAHAMKLKGGILRIGLSEKHNGFYDLSVADNGGGIPPNVIDRIFEPYFTTKAAGEGTGMGLSMVHGIVKNHGGDITVRSTEDIGTVFTVTFPAYDNSPADAAIEPIPDLQKGTETILLVDDEAAVSRFISIFLSQIGYRVHSMNDPISAIELVRSGDEDLNLIITDQNMPGMTGMEFADKVYEISREIPIILMSGLEVNDLSMGSQSLNIKKFLQKPLNISTLSAAVRECLNHPE
ncbi:MAG: response regulator [Brevinematales bacterium]|nr:response regulator [Brevinematales bacterium]